MSRAELARALPKTELHVHIEGTLEPEMMMSLARRNDIELPFADEQAVRNAYRFTDLQSFLDIYYQGAAALRTRDDFAELMAAYLDRAAADGVVHAEVFFDPQTHTHRGISFDAFMGGFRDAMADAQRAHGITADLILCFLRHLPAEDAVATLKQAENHLEGVVAVGLDSSEQGFPPHLFEEAYRRAETLGLRAVAHAGEEGPPEYVVGALDVLGAERIDHGIRSLENSDLVARLRRDRIPLTVCPFSNLALKVVDDLKDHPLPRMLAEGLLVSINSDDPAYFGGYIGDNYVGVAEAFDLDGATLADLARNSINASFLTAEAKADHLGRLEEVLARA